MAAPALRLSPHEARVAWLELIQLALGAAFAAEREALGREGQTALARRLITLRGTPFPVAYASAEALAKGFLEHVGGLACAGRPQDQARLAPVVSAGAKGLSTLIAEAQTEAAQSWKRQLPEHER